MNLSLHFFRKDLSRASWILIFWSLLVVTEGCLAFLTYPSNSSQFGANFGQPILLPLVHYLLIAVIVPLMIQEDAAVGSAAFWLTRPVSHGALLRAKLLGLGAIMLAPLIVDLVVLFLAGLPTGDLEKAFADIFLRQVSLVVPIAAVAALTPTFWRFTVVLVGSVILLTLLSAALPQPKLLPTGLADVVLFMWGGSVLAHQYLTRRTSRSIILACLGGALVTAVSVWPWALADEPLAFSTTAFDSKHLTLEVKATSLNTSTSVSLIHNVVTKKIDGVYELKGLPPAFIYQTRTVSARLIAGDGTELPSRVTISTNPPPEFDSPHVSAIAAAIGIPVHSTVSRVGSTTLASLDNSDFVRYKNSPVKLICDLDFVVSRYETDGELPLIKGAHTRSRGEGVTVGGIDLSDEGITIEIAESSVNVRFSDGIRSAGQPAELRLRGDPVYVLVNRQRNEASVVSNGTARGSSSMFYLGGLLMKKVVELPFGGERNNSAPIIDHEWLQGAVLVRLVRVPVAEFAKRAEVKLAKLGEPLRQPKSPR